MILALIIILLSCIAFIGLVIAKPSVTVKGKTVSIYWIAPLTGALLLLITKRLDFSVLISGLFSDDAINPVKILVLFISMTMLSIFLDEIGFFTFLAGEALTRAAGSQKKLFICLYALVSVLTVFTSNDIIILTFTPFICHFAKRAKIDPMPYLFAEFVAANTWSMALIIGNPTNVYLATSAGITFPDYAIHMFLPTLAGGIAAFLALWIIFSKRLEKHIEGTSEHEVIDDKGALVIGLVHLGLCTVMLVISSYINLEMWLISLAFAVSESICILIYRTIRHEHPAALLMAFKRAPWELVPFVISMFVFVLTMKSFDVTGHIAGFLGTSHVTFKYGIASFLTANVINNIPMSVFYSAIIENLPANMRMDAVYATIIGSNLGAFFTPIGALAGIMWSNILRRHRVKFSFLTFVKYGILISLPTLIAVLAVAAL